MKVMKMIPFFFWYIINGVRPVLSKNWKCNIHNINRETII